MSSDSAAIGTAHITAQTPLPPAIDAWRYFLEDQGRSLHTVKAFIADINLLAGFLPPDRTLGAITTLDLNHFLHWLQNGRGVPCSPKSLARRITSLKAFFRWLHKAGVLVVDPSEKVLQQSVLSPMPEILENGELEAVIQAAENARRAKKPDARPYTLLALLLTTGIKKGECLAINVNHLELNGDKGSFLFIRYTAPRNRYKERKIELSPEWVAAYQEYTAQYKPVDTVFPWSPRRLEYLLEDLGKEAGLRKHLSFDMCRWTCGLADWQSGMERDLIRQKMGVSKIQWREISLKLRRLAGEAAAEDDALPVKSAATGKPTGEKPQGSLR
jgi:integrase/recombinase XerD